MRLGHVTAMGLVLLAATATLGVSRGGASLLGRVMGEHLAAAVVALSLETEPPPPVVELIPDREAALLDAPAVPGARSVGPTSRQARGTPRDSTSMPRRGLRVPSAKVLQLARSGARPTGRSVPRDGDRPAGILLSGVSALGIGMMDGDVLTMAGGVPVRVPSDVVAVVVAARGRRISAINARFWRGAEPWDLVVEQPYLPAAPVSAASTPSAGAGTTPEPLTGPAMD